LVIQHLHYTREKNVPKDDISVSVDSFATVDNQAYNEYIATQFKIDMEKLA